MKSYSCKVLQLLLLVSLALSSPVLAAPRGTFVKESSPGESTPKLTLKIKRPRPERGTTLKKAIQIRGCWVQAGYKTFKAKDANKKPVRFKKSADGSVLEFKKLSSIKFPISATIEFEGELPVVQRGSSVTAVGATNCEVVKRKGKRREDCSSSQPVELRAAFSGVQCSSPSDFTEQLSDATVVFADGDQFTIRSRTEPLRFAMIGGEFLGDLTDFTVVVNDDSYVSPQVTLSNGVLSVAAPLLDGQNSTTVIAIDSEGNQSVSSFTFWAGSNSLTTLVRDSEGGVVDGGTVTLSLGDAPEFRVTLPFSGGQAVFGNIPGTTVAVSALSTDARSGFGAGAGNQGTITVVALPLLEESPIANNDISGGLSGWETGNSSVTVIPHTEDEPTVLPVTVAGASPAEIPDEDLVLRTGGEGARFMTRTFRTNPKSRLVKIRYRFQTSEFPGGYFGSRFNDFYNVSLRSSKGAQILDDGSSMNALGTSAFSPQGYTVWRSTVIPVNRVSPPPTEGDVVQAQVVVANVADGAYDSRVIVDKIEESPFAITETELLDIDNSPLSFLSTDTHPYFDGFTHIHGRITLEGEADDSIQSIRLKLMDGSTQAAVAELSTQASSKLVAKKFGKSGKLLLKNPILLFKMFPKELANLDSDSNRGFSLIVEAQSTKGLFAQSSVGNVQSLVRFDGANRYDGRDADKGGDDWVTPQVREYAQDLSGVTWGDFSNMNGGVFLPHDRHREGRSIDGWVSGYNNLDADTAESLIALLNSPTGRRIRFMYVRYSRNPGNAFYRAIAGRTLANGRRVDSVILPDGEHGTHFHVEF